MSPAHPADDGARPIPVTVQILDKDYRIACTEAEQHALMDCARLLDRRMREVRQNGRVIGADRIAVMAALNLIYELVEQRGEAGGPAVPVDRLAALQQRVGTVLAQHEDAAPVRAPHATPGRTAVFEPAPDAVIPAAGDAASGAKVALDGPSESV